METCTSGSEGGARKRSAAARLAPTLLCPDPPDAIGIAPYGGHEIKLGGNTGEGCGGAIPPRGPRHGRGHGETELVRHEAQ
jgi:hypothetical protein